MKLLINGTFQNPTDYTTGGDFSIGIITRNENEVREASISTEITLTGSAFDLVNTELIQDPAGKNKFLEVKIYEDSCCEEDILLFNGLIRGDMVNWCIGECSCTVTMIENTQFTEALNCIKSTLIDDNWNGFKSQNHPRVKYCVEMRPSAFQLWAIIMGIMANNIMLILTPIVAVLSTIIQVINTIINAINTLPIPGSINTIGGFDGNAETSLLQEWNSLKNDFNEAVIQCARKHPSPFVRSYIQNVCDKCGLGFQSSILNTALSQYYDTMYLNAPVEKGVKSDAVKFIEKNRPIFTLDTFLETLKPVFNGQYDIQEDINGNLQLIFERKDFFWSGTPFVVYDLLEGSGLIKDKLCLSWRDEQRPAFAQFMYTEDALDLCGNEAKERFTTVVSWNNPFSPIQKGKKEVIVPFSTPRFRRDGIDQDVLGLFSWVPYYTNAINSNKDNLIMSNGTCNSPKLLIWDKKDINNATVQKFVVPGFDVPPGQNYNFPYKFNRWNAAPNTAYPTTQPQMGIYGRFHAIDNPKLINDNGLEFSFSFYFNCDSLTEAPTAKYVLLPMGIGRISNLSVNLDDKSIEINGFV